jgi:photosystem II stability/assembly factor-like uncharacterized protein
MNIKHTKISLLVCSVVMTCNIASAQWQQCKGPYGGYLEKIARSPLHKLYTQGVNKIIYTSADSGQSWQALPSLPAGIHANGFAFDDDGGLVLPASEGYLTYNDNDTWTSHTLGTTSPQVEAMAVKGQVYLAATFPGFTSQPDLFTSKNGGQTWQKITTFPGFTSFNSLKTDVDASGNVICYVAVNNGVYTSLDSGTTWQTINTGLEPSSFYDELAVTENELYIRTASGIFRTAKSPISWTPTDTLPLINGFPMTPTKMRYCSGSILAFGMSGEGVYAYDTAADAWVRREGFDQPFEWSDVLSDGSHFWAATNIGFAYSADSGRTWTERNNTLPVSYVHHITASPAGNLLAGTGNGLFHTTDEGESFSKLPFSSSNHYFLKTAALGDLTVAITSSNCFIGTPEAPESWQEITDTTFLESNFAQQQYVYTEHNNIWIGTTDSLLMSPDSGTTWKHFSNADGMLRDVYLMFNLGDSLIAFSRSGTGFVTTNHGDTWEPFIIGITNFSDPASVYIHGGNIYIGNSQGVVQGTTGLNGWENFNANIHDAFSSTITGSGDTLFLSSAGKLFRRILPATQWTAQTTPPGLNVNTLYIHEGFLYAGTWGNGMWKAPVNNTSTGIRKQQMTEKAVVAYPNPATGTFALSLPDAAIRNAFISVYDVTGRLMLQHSHYSHATPVDISALTTGIYHVVVLDGNNSYHARLLVK